MNVNTNTQWLKVADLRLDTRAVSPDYSIEGFHVYDITVTFTPYFWLVILHGADDGSLPLENVLRRFLAAHPDKKVYFVCCYTARVAAKHPDLVPYILPPLRHNNDVSALVSGTDGINDWIEIKVLV